MASQLPPDLDYGETLVITWWSEFAVASVFIFLRLWARHLKRTLGSDDAVMGLAWLCFLGDAVTVHFIGRTGGTRYFVYLSQTEQQYQLKLIQITLTIGIACTGLGKIAIGITILRIVGNTSKWEKWAVWFIIVMTTITSVIDMFLNVFQCGDPRAIWDYERLRTARCLDMHAITAFNTFTNGWQTFSDFAFSLIPMRVVWKLRMPLFRRIALTTALGLTLVTGAAALVKAVMTASIDLSDITGTLGVVLTWFGTEAMLIIVCGSVPSLYPIWERFFKRPRQGYTPQGSKYWRFEYSRGWAGRAKAANMTSHNERSMAAEVDGPTEANDLELAQLTRHQVKPESPHSGVLSSQDAPVEQWESPPNQDRC